MLIWSILSINLSRPRVCDTFTLDMASLNAIVRIFLNLLASPSLSQNILNLFKSPAVHLIGKEKNRQPPRLNVWVLQKKVATSLRAKKSLSAISRENRHQAFRLRYQSCVTAPAAACPARPWPPPSSAGRWSPPRR